MKAIVTGGAGFVGTNLVKRLLKDGHEVVSLDNYSTGKKENEQEGCRYFDVDLSKVSNYDEFISSVDVIFHIGALARIQPSLTDPSPHVQNNFISTLNVLEYARVKNIPVVYAGSSSFHHGLYESPYAWSKWSGEELCKLYSNVYDLKTAICRFYNVYGPYQLEDGDYSTILGIFERQHRNGEPLTITADGQQRRDFTHVEDIVDGLVRCAGGNFKAEFFELGTGVNHSINEVAELFGEDYPKKYIPARKGEYDVTLADYSKAELKLGWKPTKKLEEYIKGVV
jgi:UDP-glucose 4-epimerase